MHGVFFFNTFLAKIPSYIFFLITIENKSDSERLFSLPHEAIWMMQTLGMLCSWDGCYLKGSFNFPPPSYSLSAANT